MRKIERHAIAVNSTSGLRSVPNPKKTAKALQRMGTHGDDILAHINAKEATLLDMLADGKLDGGGRNRRTGLRSFGMTDGESGRSGGDANPGGVGGGPAGGQTGGGLGGNTADGIGGLGGGYGPGDGYAGSQNQKAAEELGNYYRDTYINGEVDKPYAPLDTFERLLQTAWYGPPPDPGKPGIVSAPTGKYPGLASKAVGIVAAPAIGSLMAVGGWMRDSMSPEAQAKSLAENQVQGAMNSTGNSPTSPAPGADAGVGAGTAYVMPPPTASAAAPAPKDVWDEAGFLARNPEVGKAVENGTWTSGRSFNTAYKAQAGANYDSAKALGLISPYRDDMLKSSPGQAVAYRGA